MATNDEKLTALSVLSRQAYEDPATFQVTVIPDPLQVDADIWQTAVSACSEGLLRCHGDIKDGTGTILAVLLFPGLAVSGYGNFWVDRNVYPEQGLKATLLTTQAWQTLEAIEQIRVKSLKELMAAMAERLAAKAKTRSADASWAAIADARVTIAKE